MDSSSTGLYQTASLICALPEEILETILSYVVAIPSPFRSRPTWHCESGSRGSNDKTSETRTPTAVLLVSKAFLRISQPLLYHSIHLRHPLQVQALLEGSFRTRPELAGHVRRLTLAGTWACCGEVLTACARTGNNLKTLDIMLNFGVGGQRADGDPERDAQIFSKGLKHLKSITHLTVRKPDNTYLSQKGVRGVIEGLAFALEGWNYVEYVDCAFRISDDAPGSLPSLSTLVPSIVFPPAPPHTTQSSPLSGISSTSDGRTSSTHARLPSRLPPSLRQFASTKPTTPNSRLIHSLRSRPHLRTFCTRLPNTWNECMLRVSENPNLERIVLVDQMNQLGQFQAKDFYAAPVGACFPESAALPRGGHGYGQGQVLLGPGPTGLFMMQAKKHPRLCELIRAGTFIMRPRAQTLASSTPPSTPPSTTGNKSFAESQGSQNPSSSTAVLTHPSSSKTLPTPAQRLYEPLNSLAENPPLQSASVQTVPPLVTAIQTTQQRSSGRNNRHSYHHPPSSSTSPTSQAWQFYSSLAASPLVRSTEGRSSGR